MGNGDGRNTGWKPVRPRAGCPCHKAAGLSGQEEDGADFRSVAAHKVCDEVADDSVGSALSFCDDPGHQGLCCGVPFEVDSAVDVGVGAVELCPAWASARGLLA